MEERIPKIYTCFPEGKHKALTFSYDDGKLEDKRLVSLFNRYGVKGTFHINSGLFDMDIRIPAEEIKELYEGHEVAAHTLTHPTIGRCPMEQVVTQILEDRKRLEGLVGYPVRGLSYPNGSYNEEIKRLLPALGIEYARVVGNSDDFSLPEDFYEWKATCHHNHRLIELGKEFLSLHKTQYLYLMYVWGHSYEFERDKNWDMFEAFLKEVSKREDIWYATNAEIVEYLSCAKRLKFAADGSFVYNPNAASVWLTANERLYEIKGGTQTEIL